MLSGSARRRGRTVVGAVLLAILSLALAGCGEEPTPPRLVSFSPAILTVPAGETLEVRVQYEANDFELKDFQWTAAAGEIEGNGQPAITYRAPQEAGDYKLAVAVPYGEDGGELSLDTVVKVMPSAGPAVAEATEQAGEAKPAEEAAQATGEAAAPATTEATATAPAEATGEAAAPATAETAATEPAEATGEVAAPATTETAATAPAEATGEAAETTTEPAEATEEAAAQAAPASTAAEEQPPAEGGSPGSEEMAVAALPPATEATAGAPSAGSRVDQILDKKRLTAAVQIGFEPFSFYGEDGKRTGFDVDMVREFARRWLDDPTAVTFLPVPTDARIPTLVKGRADLIAAALTKTPARAEEVDFSLTYFKDGQRLLVGEGSTVTDVCDLAGKKVAAVQGSTSLDNLKAAAAKCGFDLGDNLVVVRRHEDALDAVLNGEVEAFTSDGVALENFAKGQPLKVVGNHFSEEPYAFAVPKGDARFQALVDATLKEMEADGTYAAIYEKWFGDEIRPYPLEAPEAQPVATDVAALATTTEAPAIVPPKTTPAEVVTEYVVQPGDTLSKIAGKVYGDVSPGSWQRIFEANKGTIGDDPSRIEVGMKLTIPQ